MHSEKCQKAQHSSFPKSHSAASNFEPLDLLSLSLSEYAETARDRGIQVIIAGAGGAAHLPGMCAAKTDLPVLGVPVKSSILNGVDSLLSIVQMPAGIAVGTLAIGPAGATNAAIMAAQILGLTRPEIAKNVADFRAAQTDKVASNNIPGQV